MKRCYQDEDRNVLNVSFKKSGPLEDPETFKVFFEQYKISTEMARQAIDRRIEINKFFTGAFGAAIAAAVISLRLFDATLLPPICLSLGVIGTFMAVNWYSRIVFLMDQSSIRQNVLEDFESYLPASHWRAVNARLYTEGFNDKRVERATPLLFLTAAVVISLLSLVATAIDAKDNLPSLHLKPSDQPKSQKH